MLVAVQTMTCASCRNLVDVITNVHADTEADVGRLGQAVGHCPKCRRKTELEPWGRDEWMDDMVTRAQISLAWGWCPRCTGAMVLEGEVALWD